jgi:hypothetical protein
MTRKHFVEFARAISEIKHADDRKRVAEIVANVCASINANFNRTKFYEACGV